MASLQEGEARGEARGEAKTAVAALHTFLGEVLAPTDLERIEAAWHRDGPPTDALQRIRDVLHTPNQWRSLLLPGKPDDNGPDRTPTPPEPEPPKHR